jgi:ribosomal protein S18 acetylase RimI-like enzyme
MPPTLVTIRPAVLADTAAIVSLVQRAYRGDESRVGWTTEADLLDGQRIDAEGVTAKLTSSRAEVLVGEDPAGRIVGCCELENRGSGTAYFGMFAVDPALQSSGIGRLLLEFAEERAVSQWSVSAIEMTVIEQRVELIDWYARRGYERTGEQRPFPYGDETKGLPRRADLVFAVLAKSC